MGNLAHLSRQAVLAALTANALRPSTGPRSSVWSFVLGWPTVEMAPHLLTASVVDTAISAKRGRVGPLGLTLAAASVLGLASMVSRSRTVAKVIDEALLDGLGVDTVAELDAQPTPAEVGVWRRRLNPLPGKDERVVVQRNIAYTEGGRRAKLDIHLPAEGAGPKAPVLFQVHGGAWTLGYKDNQALPLMQHMAAQGWICVAVNYRLAPKHHFPAQILDVKKALAWVKQHIAEYGGDPDYVVVTGGSAGGHLTSLAALTPNDPAYQPGFEDVDTSVQAAVPIYPVLDFSGATGLKSAEQMRDLFIAPKIVGRPYEEAKEVFEAGSPILRINPDAPDFFILHGTKDSLVDVNQARLFVEKLREQSDASVVYAELEGAQHAFDIFHSIRSGAVVRAVSRYLNWHWNRYRQGLPTETPAGGSHTVEAPATT